MDGWMWQPRDLTPSQKEERRLWAGCLLQSGAMSQSEIAFELGVSPRTVRLWSRQWRTHGSDGLRHRAPSGRPPRLSNEQWQDVLDLLKEGAQASGFPTERWTLSRIQKAVARRFGVHYNANYLGERLHHLGWSPQKPAVTARERSDVLAEAWIKGDWPRIKKSLAQRSADRVHR